MSNYKMIYANFMVDLTKAALADGEVFSLRVEGVKDWIRSTSIKSIEMDGGAIVLDRQVGGKVYMRYDQLVRVAMGGEEG